MSEATATKKASQNGQDKSEKPVQMNGAEILVRALDAEGVEIIFGHPGGAVIKIYDEMARVKPNFKHVLVRHEQGGTHAAEGYAKATGKVGTVLVTSGPGATNCVTGIADAFMDSIPIVVFTGQVPTHLIGDDAFQETDIIGVTRSITKHSYQVRDIKNLTSVVKQAYHVARTGRPGPVVVDLPKDVLFQHHEFSYPSEEDIPRGYWKVGDIDREQIATALEWISTAKKPLIYAGGGAINSNSSELVAELAHRTGIPVTTTLHGLGAFPEDDPLSLGMLGMHGTWYANQAVQNCDLLIALGARFDDRVTGKLEAWAPHAKVIHIEIDPSCVSKNIHADCPIIGDLRTVLEEMLPQVGESSHPKWLEEIQVWKDECPLSFESDGQLRPQYVIQKLDEKCKGDVVVVTDVGQNQMWAAQWFTYKKPRTHITSGGLGTMGFSMPAAMGAAFGIKDSGTTVISISGDGGFVMNAQEMSVAAAHKLPIKIVVLNNSFLGMVRQWQELFFEDRFSHTDLTDTNPDFVKLAEAMNCVGLRASSPEEVDDVIEKAWQVTDRPVLMEFKVIKEEMVFPMVPAGAATGDMITERFKED